MRFARPALLCLITLTATACATTHDQLARSQIALEQNEHEQALALLRDLERDFARLSLTERAQYAYLRGMTDYRLGHRADARHWLSLARTYDEASTGVLAADWRARTRDALAEMNTVVEENGFAALAAQKR
jgi:lipoprotein NlpI